MTLMSDYPKKTVIAYDFLDDDNALRPLEHLSFLASSEIHFVHIVPEISDVNGVSLEVMFPKKETINSIRESVLLKMKRAALEVLPDSFSSKVTYTCLFSEDVREAFCQYLVDQQADLAIVVARQKRGIFDSSFSYYAGKYSPCSVLVLKSGSTIRSFKQVVIGVDFKNSPQLWQNLKKLDFLKNSNINFLNVNRFPDIGYFSDIAFCPEKELKLVLLQKCEEKLKEFSSNCHLEEFTGDINHECVLSSNPKKDFNNFLIDHHVHLAVILESDSNQRYQGFLHYQLTHSDVPVLILNRTKGVEDV